VVVAGSRVARALLSSGATRAARSCRPRVRSLVGILVVVGCGSSPRRSPAPVIAKPTCSPAAWRQAAESTQRAWLVSLDPPHTHPAAPIGRHAQYHRIPVTVIETDGEDVLIATSTPGAIVTRWVPTSALGRAAMAPASVSPAPGATPDPAVRIGIGYKLPASGDAWPSVRHSAAEITGLELFGVVPVELRGVVWDEPRRNDTRRGWHHAGVIRSAPRADAPILAKVTYEAEIDIRGHHNNWFEVTARTAHAAVDGYLERPPPPPPRPSRPGSYEFSDESIEGELVVPASPLAAGTCLYDAPNGNAVGMILGHQPAEPRPASRPGWVQLELATLWGGVTYFTDALPIEQPEPIDPEAWRFESSSGTNEIEMHFVVAKP